MRLSGEIRMLANVLLSQSLNTRICSVDPRCLTLSQSEPQSLPGYNPATNRCQVHHTRAHFHRRRDRSRGAALRRNFIRWWRFRRATLIATVVSLMFWHGYASC